MISAGLNLSFIRSAYPDDVPSYFDMFGDVSVLSRHAWRRLQEREVGRVSLHAGLSAEPVLGTSVGTVIYRAVGIDVVVNANTGMIVSIWWA